MTNEFFIRVNPCDPNTVLAAYLDIHLVLFAYNAQLRLKVGGPSTLRHGRFSTNLDSCNILTNIY